MDTKTQQEALNYISQNKGKRRFIYWQGGVRSGKSYGSAMGMLEHALESPGDKLYIILAYTSPQGMTIYSPYFQTLAKQQGLDCVVRRGTYDPHIMITHDQGSAKFMIRGADNDAKASAIQGLTIHGLLADEVANLNRATLHQAEARISEPGALRLYTSNKTSPYHWSTKYYVDRLQEGLIDGVILDSQTSDNKNVDNAYLEERKSEYQGDTLARFIDNKYTLDARPLYKASIYGYEANETINEESYCFIHKSPTGFDILRSQEDCDGRIIIVSGKSCDGFDEDDIGNPATTRCWINSGQQYTPDWFHSRNYLLNTYLNGYKEWKLQVIQQAFESGKLNVAHDCATMLEAINMYSIPGKPEYQIIHALEGMSDMLRYQ